MECFYEECQVNSERLWTKSPAHGGTLVLSARLTRGVWRWSSLLVAVAESFRKQHREHGSCECESECEGHVCCSQVMRSCAV